MFGIRKRTSKKIPGELDATQKSLLEEIERLQTKTHKVRADILALNPTQIPPMGMSPHPEVGPEYRYTLPEVVTDEFFTNELASQSQRLRNYERLYQATINAFIIEIRWIAAPMLRIIEAADDSWVTLTDFDVKNILDSEKLLAAYEDAYAEFTAKNANVMLQYFDIHVEDFSAAVEKLKADPTFPERVKALA